MLGDYIFAFTVLGFAGLFSKKRFGFFYGTLLGSALRFLVHYVVGATVWGEYMPETFFGMTMTSPWFYSALYNGSYMVLDCALVLLGMCVLFTVLGLVLYYPARRLNAAIAASKEKSGIM